VALPQDLPRGAGNPWPYAADSGAPVLVANDHIVCEPLTTQPTAATCHQAGTADLRLSAFMPLGG